MTEQSNYKDLWKLTSQAEKERIFSMFLKKYGENYTSDDFVKFLKERYKVTDKTPNFVNWRQSF